MAFDLDTDDTATEETEDWSDIDALLSDEEPVIEQAERETDNEMARLKGITRKLAEKEKARERQEQRDKMVGAWMATAPDDAKDMAEILIAGVQDPGQVKKMLDLAMSKVKTEPAPKTDEDESEGDAAMDALAPPIGNGPPRVADPDKEYLDRIARGDREAALQYWLKDSVMAPHFKGKR